MTNYRSTNRNKIIIAGFETVIGKAVPIHLTEQTINDTAADAMYKDSAVYSVPTGKKFILLGVRVYVDSTGGGDLAIWEGATEDAETSLKQTVDLAVAGVNNVIEYYIHSVSFAAGKFITINPSGTQVEFVELLGYEEIV